MPRKNDGLPNQINEEFYRDLAEKMLRDVAEDFCRHCDKPIKTGGCLDFDNPLNCNCRCDAVKGVLEVAEELLLLKAAKP